MAPDRIKHLKSAEKYIAAGKIQQAIEEYLEILKGSQHEWNLMIQIADLYLKINRTQEAIQYFQKVADYYYVDELHLKAMAIYKRINKLDPNLTDICIRLAELQLKQGLTMDAKPQLQAAAQHYLSKNQTKDAIQVLKKLIQIEPDNLSTRNDLAKALKSEGMISEAVNEYVEISDNLLSKNLLNECLSALQSAYKMDHRNPTILRKLVAIYKKQNDKDQITKFLEELLHVAPANTEVLADLAELYVERGDYTRAQHILERLIKLEPDKEQHRAKLDLVHSFLSQQQKHGSAVDDKAHSVPLFTPLPEEVTAPDLEILEEPHQKSVKIAELEIKPEMVSAASEAKALIPPALLDAVRGLQPIPSETTTPVSAELDILSAERDFVSDHMIEADVFIQYELFNKAIEQLLMITQHCPNFIAAHQKLKDIHLTQGEKSKAIEECITISKILRGQGNIDEAENLLNEAREIDSNNYSVEVESVLVNKFKEMQTSPASGALSEIQRLAQSLREMVSATPEQPSEEGKN